jgi:hypothetical protein
MVGGSPSTQVSSTTKTGLHDIAESGVKQNKSNQIYYKKKCHFQLLVSVINFFYQS